MNIFNIVKLKSNNFISCCLWIWIIYLCCYWTCCLILFCAVIRWVLLILCNCTIILIFRVVREMAICLLCCILTYLYYSVMVKVWWLHEQGMELEWDSNPSWEEVKRECICQGKSKGLCHCYWTTSWENHVHRHKTLFPGNQHVLVPYRV